MYVRCLLLLALLLAPAAASAEMPAAKAPIQITAEAMTWKEGPPTLPPGAKMMVLEGSPKSTALFTIRLQVPAKYTVPVHTHPADERVTVISGTVYVGLGDTADLKAAKRFEAGSYYVTPPGVRHYVLTKDEGAVLQMTSVGPWGLEYVK